MDHPLLSDISSLTDEQIVEKINSLTQKWFQTRNPDAQHQIQTMLDTYKLEMIDRSSKSNPENGNKDLDNLINVS
jgi:HEPN domain-containing protein